MPQPNMLCYGAGKPQYPMKLNSSQQWGDFTTEAQKIRKDLNREHLEKHFEHRGNAGRLHPAPHSHFRDSGLSQGERHHISDIKSATRAALGPSFEFDDDSYNRSHTHTDTYQQSRGWMNPIENKVDDVPQEYIDEFNQKWHEDDEDNDADQYLADHVKEAAWRKHAPSAYPVPSYSIHSIPSSGRSRATISPVTRTDSGYGSMTSHSLRETPEHKESSYRSQRPENFHRPKTSILQENSYRSQESKRPYMSYRAGQARREQGPGRPRTPIPGLVSAFSWDVDVDEKQAKKRRGGFFSGFFRRH